jgi:hypothetical protein
VYAAVLVVLVLLAWVAVRLAYAHGELNKISMQAAPSATPLPTTSTAADVSLRWRTDDHPAAGNPYGDGIVVTYSGHTVNGRDARTGQVRWHYTRSNELVCDVVQQDGSTIASYQRDGNCDEVTGFTTSTGRPKWYRTLQDNGRLAVSSTSNVVLIVAPTTVHVFDNFSGLDRWTFTGPNGCTVDRALGGTLGVLIAYHCGQQNHLTLHELTGQSENQQWTIDVGEPYVPIASGAVVAAAGATSGVSYLFDAAKGTRGARLDLGSAATVKAAVRGAARSSTTVEATGTDNQPVEFVAVGGLVCLNNKGIVLWRAPASGPASTASSQVVLAPLPGKVALYRASDGTVERTIPIRSSATATGDFRADAVGSGLLVTGLDVAYYG